MKTLNNNKDLIMFTASNTDNHFMLKYVAIHVIYMQIPLLYPSEN